MKVTPLHDRVLVRRIEETQSSKNRIIVADSAKEKPQQGEVIAVGRLTQDVKSGNKILFGKYSGNDIKIDGEDFLIMKEDEILAKID
jgi:chaperonin GroES